MNILVPCILINYLAVVSFMIPCCSGEKTRFDVTVFLAQTVNFMGISQYIPEGGTSIPVFENYLLASICFIVVIIVINVQLMKFYKTIRPKAVLASAKWEFFLEHVCVRFGPDWGDSEDMDPNVDCSSPTEPQEGADNVVTEENEHLGEQRVSKQSRNQEKLEKSVSQKMEMVCETINRICLVVAFGCATVSTASMLAVIIIQ